MYAHYHCDEGVSILIICLKCMIISFCVLFPPPPLPPQGAPTSFICWLFFFLFFFFSSSATVCFCFSLSFLLSSCRSDCSCSCCCCCLLFLLFLLVLIVPVVGLVVCCSCYCCSSFSSLHRFLARVHVQALANVDRGMENSIIIQRQPLSQYIQLYTFPSA